MTDDDSAFLVPEIQEDAYLREKERLPHQFQPGQSGNPLGRKRGSASVREWINALLNIRSDGTPSYPLAEIRGLAKEGQNADLGQLLLVD